MDGEANNSNSNSNSSQDNNNNPNRVLSDPGNPRPWPNNCAGLRVITPENYNDFVLTTNASSSQRLLNRLQAQRFVGQYYCPIHGHHAAVGNGGSGGGESSGSSAPPRTIDMGITSVLSQEMERMAAAFRVNNCIIRFEPYDEDESEDEEDDEEEDPNHLNPNEMTYEDLLDLEEEIGQMPTGITEEMVRTHLGQQKHQSASIGSSKESELCPICQDEFKDGEDVGKLGCGHGYHFECIKEWLARKNVCPICKKRALSV